LQAFMVGNAWGDSMAVGIKNTNKGAGGKEKV